jgi:glycosyltransferase involved in cell wall biosynthesis
MQVDPPRVRRPTEATVSVVIPVYNGAAYLQEALESVLAQTRPPHEVIVVDDGSSDDSSDIATAFGPRVTCLRKENGGAASARNAGIMAASCEFLAFIDHDDLWPATKLERQLACFEQNCSLDLCYALADFFWDAALAEEQQAYRDHPRTRQVPGYTTPALLARRTAFQRVGLLNEDLHFADATEWTMRALDAGLRVELLPEVLLYHRMHKSNLTRRREQSQHEFLRLIWCRLKRRRGERDREIEL